MRLPPGEGELTITVPTTPQLRYGIVAFGPSGSWNEDDGLQQGTFVTDQGSTTVYSEGNLQFGASIDFDGQALLSTASDTLVQPGAMASSDGLVWTFVSQPALPNGSTVAVHNGELYR